MTMKNKNGIWTVWVMIVLMSAISIHAELTKVVMIYKNSGGAHRDACNTLNTEMQKIATAENFQFLYTEKESDLTYDALKDKAQVVIFCNNDGGDGIIPQGPAQSGFQRWVEEGGGLIFIHAGGAFLQDWGWLHAMTVQPFWRHDPANTRARVFVAPEALDNDTLKLLMAGIPQSASYIDEYYSFRGNPVTVNQYSVDWALGDNQFHPEYVEEVTPLLVADEESYNPGTRMGYHPLAWTRKAKQGRVIYNSIGHNKDLYTTQVNAAQLTFTHNMIKYVAGELDPVPAACKDSNYIEYDPDSEGEHDQSLCKTPVGVINFQKISSDYINVKGLEVKIAYSGNYRISVFSANGNNVSNHNGMGPESWKAPHLSGGIYYLKVSTPIGLIHQKILID